MTSKLLPIAATTVVRTWTRMYTCGLPRVDRAARLAEIDSDLWEFEHDPEAPQGIWAATQILARLLIGIPDDFAWRQRRRFAFQDEPPQLWMVVKQRRLVHGRDHGDELLKKKCRPHFLKGALDRVPRGLAFFRDLQHDRHAAPRPLFQFRNVLPSREAVAVST